jgi:hypothetical protein
VVVDLDPGIAVGDVEALPEQTVVGVWLNDEPVEWGDSTGNLPFSRLDGVSASEMVRDLDVLTGGSGR